MNDGPVRSLPQPVVNAAHTHIQVFFTDNTSLLFPIHHMDAEKAIAAWGGGSPKLSLRPADGSAFHVNAGTVKFLRQVTEAVAASMIAEQQQMDAGRRAAAEAQLAEQRKVAEHNEQIREMQLSGLKAQLARGGVITTG